MYLHRMQNFFKGKSILITGATGGLGNAIIAELISYKPKKILLVGRNKKILSNLQKYVESSSIECFVKDFDVNNEELIVEFFKELNSELIDVAILLSGVSLSANEDGFEDFYEINRGFQTNTISNIKFIYAISKHFKDKETKGSIAVVSSIAALLNLSSSPVYCASKLALNCYVESLRPLLAKSNIDISLVLPGFFTSNMSKRYQGKKLFEITAQAAAIKILKGIANKKKQIIFPKFLYFLILLINLCPASIQRIILKKFQFSVIPDKDRQSFLNLKN
jgi:short-subunit dehydrogenase